MRYGYVTVNALRHVTDASISAKSMCVENRIDASGSCVFLYIFTSNTEKSFSSHARSMQAMAKAIFTRNLSQKFKVTDRCMILVARIIMIRL